MKLLLGVRRECCVRLSTSVGCAGWWVSHRRVVRVVVFRLIASTPPTWLAVLATSLLLRLGRKTFR